jgi:hypothetical protein
MLSVTWHSPIEALLMARPAQVFSEHNKRWLSEQAAVWRYVPLRTLFFYLNGLVFIPSVEKLRASDPFEGEFYEDIVWYNTAFHQHYGADARKIEEWIFESLCSDSERHQIEINNDYPNAAAVVFRKHYFDFVRKTRFAWCWFHSCRESAAMWSIYGHQGVAIQSTIGRLTDALGKTGREFIYGQMTYVDYRNGVGVGFVPERESDFHLLLRPFFLKRSEYESEKEVRFVTVGAERAGRDGVLVRDVDPKDWISAIRLWPGITTEEEKSLCKIVQQFLPHADCQKSDLFSGSDGPSQFVEMCAVELEKSRDSKWLDGQDGIPSRVKAP